MALLLFLFGCAGLTTSSSPSSPQAGLSLSSTAFNFNSVVVGQTQTQTLHVSNGSNTPIQLTSLSLSSKQFGIAGPSVPRSLLPATSVDYVISFAPTAGGSTSAILTIVSNASNSPASVSLTGDGVTAPPVQHTVHLTWDPSTSVVAGYRVYRSTVSGNFGNPLYMSPVDVLTYDDATVASGTTYYYTVTAVDSAGVESVHSNSATAVVPTP